MKEVRTLYVDNGEDGVRLDRWFKRRWPHLNHIQIQKLARSGQIRVDGARAKPDTRLSARRILANKRFLCASPGYLKRAGIPETPDDLARHSCILHRQNNGPGNLWRLGRGRREQLVKVRGALSGPSVISAVTCSR